MKENTPPSESKSPLPPRPPNTLKRKISNDFIVENGVSGSSDTGVKVVIDLLKKLNNAS